MSFEADSRDRLQLQDLLEECANATKPVEEVSHAISSFAKSESAPDTKIFSDLLLDTLFLYDSGISPEEESTISAQRERLGSLITSLIEGQCIIEQDAYERLEAPLLFAANLIADAKAFEKKHVKINTNLLYRQQKFNLLREENEGYSKLVTEVEAFLAVIPNEASKAKAREFLENVKSLIGYFDLDPNRVLDIMVELSAGNIVTHWRFLLAMFKLSPWFDNIGQDTSVQFGDIQNRHGNQAAAQIIGFKFQQIRNLDDDDRGLVMLTALFIKEGLIRLQDLWNHLAPEDSVLAKEKSAYQNHILDEVDKAKGRNALAMAGGLDDETPTDTTDTKMQDTPDGTTSAPVVRKDNNQKIGLFRALLSVGCLPEYLFIHAEFSFLLQSHKQLANAYNNILETMIGPLYESLRPHKVYKPSTMQSLHQAKKVPEELKYRDSTLVLPEPPIERHVLELNAQSTDSKENLVFFYDEIHSQLALCTKIENFDELVLPYLRLAGIQIFRQVSLCTKIARIGKHAISTSTDVVATRKVWQTILRSSLLPALSLIEACPAIVNDVFSLVKEYSTEERYSLYGEWFADSYKRIPELKVQFVKTEKETKSLLRRISKTNTKEYGRRLAKVSHSNPCIVLSIALNQIESYDNLMDVVIEASRYFTLLSFDVLVYIMLTLLSNTQKRRLKEDGTSVAHWLQSLSSFSAKIFKRYSHMDASPICVYVAKQLKTDNALDLIILRDLIVEMASVRPTSDLSVEQLQGCGGGPLLRVEALALINERRDPQAKAPLRLLHALDKVGLTYTLPIMMGQQRSKCVYTIPEEDSLLKLLANLADEVSQILIQYLEFLTLNTSEAHYAASIPSVTSMIQDNSLEPVVAFMIARPAIQAAIHQHNLLVQRKTSIDVSDSTTTSIEDQEMKDVEQVAETDLEMTDIPSTITEAAATPIPAVIKDLVVQVRDVLPDETWKVLDSNLYATFWSLSLYDLVVPTARYEKEIAIIAGKSSDVKKFDAVEMDAKSKNAELERLSKHQQEFEAELLSQTHNHAEILKMFASQKGSWFHVDPEANKDAAETLAESAHAFIQHCLLPRCMSSPNDASYCSKFLYLLHTTGSAPRCLFEIYQSLFGIHLSTIVFTSTEREAECLGRFLGDVLKYLNFLSEDEAAYSTAKIFRTSKGEDLEKGDKHYTWAEYNALWYGSFHRNLWTTAKLCFNSKEYMQIRNILIVLERVNASFPYFKWIGKNVEKEIDMIISSERREDLKIRALGYKAVLKKQQSSWHEVPGKQSVAQPTGTPAADKTESLPLSTTPSVKGEQASTAQQLESNTLVVESRIEQEDKSAEVLEEKATAATTTTTSSLQSSDEQKEAAKRKAASLSQELRARQEKARLEQAATTQTQKTTNGQNGMTASQSKDSSDKDAASRVSNESAMHDGGRAPRSSRNSHAPSRQASPSSTRTFREERPNRADDREPPNAGTTRRPERGAPRDFASQQDRNTDESRGPNSRAYRSDRGPRDFADERDFRDQGRGRAAPSDQRLGPSTRSTRSSNTADVRESTVGRLNDHNYDNRQNDAVRGSRPSTPDHRSRDSPYEAGGRSTSGSLANRPRSDGREFPQDRTSGSQFGSSQRSNGATLTRDAPDGARSLSARISGPDDDRQNMPRRNASGSGRESTRQIERSGNDRQEPSANQPSSEHKEPFVHPSRLAASPAAATAQRNRPDADVRGRTNAHRESSGPATVDNPIHSSRQAPHQRGVPADDRRQPTAVRGPRSGLDAQNSSSVRDSQYHNELPRSANHEPRDRDTRPLRDSGPAPRDLRGGPRDDHRSSGSNDYRERRNDSGLDRVNTRPQRDSGRNGSRTDEVSDQKRRLPVDSREGSRPTKQRRQ